MTKNDKESEPESVNEDKLIKVKIKGETMSMSKKELAAKIEKALENSGIEDLDKIMAKVDKAMAGVDKKISKAVAKIDKEFGEINVDIEVDDGNHDHHHHHHDEDDGDYMKNVGVLNLKNITEEELDDMKPIRNVGVIIVPEHLIGKVSAKIKSNVGVTIPYKEGWRLYSGHTEIDNSMLEALDEPLEFIQTGHLEFNDDVDAKLLKEKIKAFNNYGKISAPEEIYGVVMAKCLENSGQISKKKDEDDDDDDDDD